MRLEIALGKPFGNINNETSWSNQGDPLGSREGQAYTKIRGQERSVWNDLKSFGKLNQLNLAAKKLKRLNEASGRGYDDSGASVTMLRPRTQRWEGKETLLNQLELIAKIPN